MASCGFAFGVVQPCPAAGLQRPIGRGHGDLRWPTAADAAGKQERQGNI